MHSSTNVPSWAYYGWICLRPPFISYFHSKQNNLKKKETTYIYMCVCPRARVFFLFKNLITFFGSEEKSLFNFNSGAYLFVMLLHSVGRHGVVVQ